MVDPAAPIYAGSGTSGVEHVERQRRATGPFIVPTSDKLPSAMLTETTTSTDVDEGDPPVPPAPGRDQSDRQRALHERTLAEATIVIRAQEQDADAFSELVRRYEAELFRLAFRMLSDRGAAQDVVQESLLLAWRKLPTLLEPQAFHGWIYHITTRQCLSQIRTRDRRKTEVHDDAELERDAAAESTVASGRMGEGPAQAAETAARLQTLDTVLKTLLPELRACWVLKELHDLSYAEISYALGIPASTVRGRLVRARRLLAKGMTSWR